MELPGRGDPVREWGSQVDGTSLVWKGLARNKRLITLALNRPEGQRMFLHLVDQFDVLIENFRPGVMERWGLGPEALHERLASTQRRPSRSGQEIERTDAALRAAVDTAS
jgi:crotonobetainyl-CoA:carnitine CoA-transferase CaiB-like acyl-CoA transferase